MKLIIIDQYIYKLLLRLGQHTRTYTVRYYYFQIFYYRFTENKVLENVSNWTIDII